MLKFSTLLLLLLTSIQLGFSLSVRIDGRGGAFIDINDDKLQDYRVYQKDNIVDIFYEELKVKKNITIKRDDREHLKEFKEFDRGNWKLVKRVRIVRENEFQQRKTIQKIIDNKKVREKVYIISSKQSFEDLTPIIPSVGEGRFDDNSLIQDRIFRATRDCLTLEIKSRGMSTNVEGLLEALGEASFSWDDYINFEGCGDVCATGMEELTCPSNTDRIKCPIVMKDILINGLQEKLTCLSSLNRELSAELLGVLFNKKKKLTLQCKPRKELGSAYGTSKTNCQSEYPLIKLSNIGCMPNKQGHDSPMMFNIESLQGTLLHELIHTTGQGHGEHPDFAYACQAACMKMKDDALSRFYKEESNMVASATENAARGICRGELGAENSSEYVNDMLLITDNVGSSFLFHGFLNRSLRSGEKYSADPLELFESLYRDSNYYLDKKRKFDIQKWEPPEGEWEFCTDASAENTNCQDPNGKFRVKFFRKIVSDPSVAPMMINLFMNAPNTKNLRTDFVNFISRDDTQQFVNPSDMDLVSYGGVLKDVMVISDLKRVGEKLSQGKIDTAISELEELRSKRKEALVRYPHIKEHRNFHQNFVSGVKTQMKSLCIENIEEIKSKPITLDVCKSVLR